MDTPALRIANRLVGNAEELAAIEITLAGPELHFESDAWIALAGSRFEATIEGRSVPYGESVLVRAAETLTVGRSLEGARAVLAVRGGIDVPVVLASRSTCLAGAFGGLEGRALRAGDHLPVGRAPEAALHRRLRAGWPGYESECALRAVAGPQIDRFDAAARDRFFAATYTVSPRSDRTGLRLDGPRVESSGDADVWPEGMVPGVVQVPADGLPILLGADSPVTGGYAKIAVVIAADLWRVAQAKPGDRVRFVDVGVDEARQLHRDQEELLRSIVVEPR